MWVYLARLFQREEAVGLRAVEDYLHWYSTALLGTKTPRRSPLDWSLGRSLSLGSSWVRSTRGAFERRGTRHDEIGPQPR